VYSTLKTVFLKEKEKQMNRVNFFILFLILPSEHAHFEKTPLQGMPVTKFPDALLVIPAFPPSKTIIQALLDGGFYFRLGFPVLRIFFYFV
jgi:hypothetical protein